MFYYVSCVHLFRLRSVFLLAILFFLIHFHDLQSSYLRLENWKSWWDVLNLWLSLPTGRCCLKMDTEEAPCSRMPKVPWFCPDISSPPDCVHFIYCLQKKKKKKRRPSIILHITFAAVSIPYRAWWGFPGGSVGKEFACDAGDPGLIPGLGKTPGERDGNPVQYFCLENPMDRGAWWWAAVHGVAKSQTQPND